MAAMPVTGRSAAVAGAVASPAQARTVKTCKRRGSVPVADAAVPVMYCMDGVTGAWRFLTVRHTDRAWAGPADGHRPSDGLAYSSRSCAPLAVSVVAGLPNRQAASPREQPKKAALWQGSTETWRAIALRLTDGRRRLQRRLTQRDRIPGCSNADHAQAPARRETEF
jgi:hypothetical protein